MNQEMTLMIQTMLSNGMSVSQIAKCVSKSEEEIMKWISQPPVWWLFQFPLKVEKEDLRIVLFIFNIQLTIWSTKIVYEESENGKNSKCSYEVFDANCEQA